MTIKQRRRVKRLRALCSGRVVDGQVVIVPASDPNYTRWVAEGSPTPQLFANGLTDEMMAANRRRAIDWPEV